MDLVRHTYRMQGFIAVLLIFSLVCMIDSWLDGNEFQLGINAFIFWINTLHFLFQGFLRRQHWIHEEAEEIANPRPRKPNPNRIY